MALTDRAAPQLDVSSLMHTSLFSRVYRFCLVVLFAVTGPLTAQDFEGKTISNVAIRYVGPKTVNEQLLRNRMTTKAGTKYRAENLDADIAALYESGLVDDVRFLAEPVGNRVNLIAEVTTRPTISGVGFMGQTKFSEKKLAKESGLKSGGVMSDAEVLAARRKLEEYYAGYGFPDVIITTEVQDSGVPGQSELIFIINEGQKNEVRKIRFEGNTVFTDNELRKEMTTKEKGWFSWITKSGRFESDQLDEDLNTILDYYRSRGYLRVSSPGIRREPVKDGRLDLVIQIQEGEKYTVAGVGFGKMTVFKPEDFYPLLTLNSEDAYSSKKMRNDIKTMRSYYGSRGYADASVTPDIRDAGPNRVTIIYRITEGGRVKVGRVNIAGNTKTKDKVIRREIPLKPGDWFNSVELETTQARLTSLNYFSQVRALGSPAGNGYRDVDVIVQERATGSVGLGIGFSSIDSFVGFINLEQANFDLFNPWNFTGGGQRFSANLMLGTERQDIVVSIVEPWFMDKQLAFGVDAYYRQQNFLNNFFDQTDFGTSIFIRKPLGKYGSIRLGYTLENIDIDSEVSARDTFPNGTGGTDFDPSDPTSGANSFLAQETIGGDLFRSALEANYIHDTRDSAVLPRTGHRIDAGITYAGLGGDVDTFTVSVRGQQYWNLKWDTILTLNAEIASVDAVSGDDVPIFERMFLGGARMLRGFEFRDIGPRDDGYTNDVYGGNSLGFLSLEYTIPIIDTVRFAVFSDTGFVNLDSWDFAPDDIYADAGVGLRLILPISPLPLALDYAVPVSSPDPQADKGGQFQFYLNYEY